MRAGKNDSCSYIPTFGFGMMTKLSMFRWKGEFSCYIPVFMWGLFAEFLCFLGTIHATVVSQRETSQSPKPHWLIGIASLPKNFLFTHDDQILIQDMGGSGALPQIWQRYGFNPKMQLMFGGGGLRHPRIWEWAELKVLFFTASWKVPLWILYWRCNISVLVCAVISAGTDKQHRLWLSFIN